MDDRKWVVCYRYRYREEDPWEHVSYVTASKENVLKQFHRTHRNRIIDLVMSFDYLGNFRRYHPTEIIGGAYKGKYHPVEKSSTSRAPIYNL